MGEWKAPMEGYDYLKLEDEGTTQLNDQSVANEYGLGESIIFIVQLES